MQPLKKRWHIAPPISLEADKELQDYHPILRQILYNRGYPSKDQALQYLQAKIPQGTAPTDMLGVSEAVDRIHFAIKQKEPIAVYGDFDADGVTATALLMQVLNALDADVHSYIPNRFEEGYGLNNEAIETLHDKGIRVIITVDCGIRAFDQVKLAQKLGIDMIISDHHTPLDELPQAIAIINPKQANDSYPEKYLAGVALAYKIASVLIERIAPDNIRAEDFLDLVAIGSVADLAPLVGENRALVRAGLKRIRQPRFHGLNALIGVSGLKPNNITAGDIGFVLGPRINAAGRLTTADNALNLLTSTGRKEAGRLAQVLDNQNRQRQAITREIQTQAEKIAQEEDPDALLLFAAHPDFNPGVVGLAASRLTDLYYLPSIVAHRGPEFTRASCRSIPEFHITESLDQCARLLERHGGHAAAAGFTVRNANLPVLIERLKTIAHEQLSQKILQPTLQADMDVSLSDLKPKLLEYLELLQPTGYGNPQACFVTRDVKVVNSRTVGRENTHLKMTLTEGGITFDAIAFRQGFWKSNIPEHIDIAYHFELNEYNGRTSLQLNVRDIKSAGGYQ